MIIANLNVEDFTVDTIDREQGTEWDIVIADVLIENTAGFQKILNRLNVLFSRAKYYLYVLVTKSQIGGLRDAKWLKNFLSSFLPYRY